MDDAQPPMYYVASLLVDGRLPGFREAQRSRLRRARRQRATEHLDRQPRHRVLPLRCAEQHRLLRRRPAPFHPVSAGADRQPVSGAAGTDARRAGGERGRFRQLPTSNAIRVSAKRSRAGQSAVLEPGDAIFIPSMWWHHVQGLERSTCWSITGGAARPRYIPTPMHALYHALWTIRDRPEREKQAWREVFDYYVFGAGRARRRTSARSGAHTCSARSTKRSRGSCGRC